MDDPRQRAHIEPDGYIVQQHIEKAIWRLQGTAKQLETVKEWMMAFCHNSPIKVSFLDAQTQALTALAELLEAQSRIKDKRRGDSNKLE
jgi:hypothetical protein